MRAAILSAIGAGLVAIGCYAPMALAASPAPGTLTDHEYTLLSAAELGLQQAVQDKGKSWSAAARTACLSTAFGVSTPLLTSEKVDCLGAITLEGDLSTFPASDAKCETRGTNSRIRCLAPLYRTLARDSASAYARDLKLRQVTVTRGFIGACLATLAPTQKQLRDGHSLAASTKQLSSDMAMLLNSIAAGRAQPSTVNQSRVAAHTRVFNHDMGQVLRDSSPNDLNSCRHMPV